MDQKNKCSRSLKLHNDIEYDIKQNISSIVSLIRFFLFLTWLVIFSLSIASIIISATATSFPTVSSSRLIISFSVSITFLLSISSKFGFFVFGHRVKKIIFYIFFRVSKNFIVQYDFLNVLRLKCFLCDFFVMR